MISVLPVKKKERLCELYSNAKLSPTPLSGAVEATDGSSVLGFCLFELSEKGIEIRSICPESDILLADGLLRSALHIAAGRSAMDARFSDTVSESLLSKLGFVKSSEEKKLDIDKLFGGCNCKGQ